MIDMGKCRTRFDSRRHELAVGTEFFCGGTKMERKAKRKLFFLTPDMMPKDVTVVAGKTFKSREIEKGIARIYQIKNVRSDGRSIAIERVG